MYMNSGYDWHTKIIDFTTLLLGKEIFSLVNGRSLLNVEQKPMSIIKNICRAIILRVILPIRSHTYETQKKL